MRRCTVIPFALDTQALSFLSPSRFVASLSLFLSNLCLHSVSRPFFSSYFTIPLSLSPLSLFDFIPKLCLTAVFQSFFLHCRYYANLPRIYQLQGLYIVILILICAE